MNINLKKYLSSVLAAALFAGSCSLGLGYSPKVKAAATFDDKNIVLTFSTISDTHIQGSADYDSTKKFRKALAQLQNRAKADNKNLDAIMIAGDITDYGTPEQIRLFNDALQARMDNGLDLNATKLLLSMGNHEIYDAELTYKDNGTGDTQAEAVPHYHGGTTYKQILGDKMYTGTNTAEQVELGFLHTVINGYHFINFSLYNYDHGLRYEAKELQWLKDALTQANAEDPNKPIFFAMHATIKGTTLGSNYGSYWALDDPTFYDVLKQYPQLVTFGGHLHFPLQDERSIYQKDFTSVETGSVYYNSLESGITNTKTGEQITFQDINGSEPEECRKFSQGLYIQVDKNNNVRINRLDFFKGDLTGAQIKEPWVIPAPNAADHLKAYTPDTYEIGNTAPKFDFAAKVTVTPYDKVNDPNHLIINFDQAKDNDMVQYYQIRFVDKTTGKEINKLYKYSDYFLHPTMDLMAPNLEFRGEKRAIYPMKPNYPNDYYVEVRAYDCYGLAGAPIASDTIAGDPSGNVEVPAPSLDPHSEWQYKPFTTFDYLEVGYTPQTGVDFDGWPTSKAADFHPYVPVSKNGFNNTPAITKKINGGANAFDVWSLNKPAEEFSKAFNTDFDGAVEFWAWVDFSQVKFDAFYFGFRSEIFYGGEKEYITEVSSSISGIPFFIQDGKGGWIQKEFDSTGKMQIGGYKGFIRFAVEDFYNAAQIPLYPSGLKTLKFWYNIADDQDYSGKTFTIDQVGFAGPKVAGSTMTVGEMKAQDGSAKVTAQELSAACTGAKAKIDAGQKNYSGKTWTAFNDAYTAATKVSSNASAADIYAAYIALKTAQNALAEEAPTTTATSSTTTTTSTSESTTTATTNSTTTTAPSATTTTTSTEPTQTDTKTTESLITTTGTASKTTAESSADPTAKSTAESTAELTAADTTTANEASPHTGDSSPAAACALIMLAAACGSVIFLKKKR